MKHAVKETERSNGRRARRPSIHEHPPGSAASPNRGRVLREASRSTLTAPQRREIATLAVLPDTEIDYSDIPPLNDQFWSNAVRNPFYRPVKRQITVRLDADVVAWLQQEGKGYQTRLNSLLRSVMLKEHSTAPRS